MSTANLSFDHAAASAAMDALHPPKVPDGPIGYLSVDGYRRRFEVIAAGLDRQARMHLAATVQRVAEFLIVRNAPAIHILIKLPDGSIVCAPALVTSTQPEWQGPRGTFIELAATKAGIDPMFLRYHIDILLAKTWERKDQQWAAHRQNMSRYEGDAAARVQASARR
ncbi:hypothetical protein OVY01_11765 [Robbsia sp. Bb-Pol-6]|uniref:Uncharacterized protein n=1 Tax=Robbsia betulipollinis TaxID=2981849 RepID=A0ABT3ZN17_9BURK|nr:hypothetical protein [Robbsia betulipollinis]MCY0387901.1 hypothetical protein [Robbsia betulipollinis]